MVRPANREAVAPAVHRLDRHPRRRSPRDPCELSSVRCRPAS